MTVKMSQRSTSTLTTISSSPLSVKEQFEASASKLWSTVKTFKTDADTMTTTTSATTSTMKKQHHQQQQQQQQDDSLMSTSSHSQSREGGDDGCSYSSSIRSHPGGGGQEQGNQNGNPQVVLFQSVLHAMFSSCTTGVPYQSPTSTSKASRREKYVIGSSSSHRTRSTHRNKSSSSSSNKSAMGDSDLFLEEEEEQQIKNETRHSNVRGGDAADPVAATADTKLNPRTQKTEKLRRPVDVVVQSTSEKLSSATKKLFSSSSDAAAAVHAVNHLRETQAAQQQERQKHLVQSLLEQKQRRQERRTHSSIVQSVATSAATASHHHQDQQDDFMMFQGHTQNNNKKMSGSPAFFSSSSDHPAARKDRPSSSSFFPASNPFRNKPREVSSSPPRKPNGKAYPTISYGSSFDLDDDGVSIITQHTVDVMAQVMEKEDPNVPYIQRVFSDCTDPVDTQFAQWNDAHAPAVESSPDATTPSTTMQTMSSPPRFSRETRSTGAHSFFTKTSQSTETEDIHSVWKKEEQQYWASLVENEGKDTATSPLKSRRSSRGTRKSSHPKQRLEDLPEERKVTNDLSTGSSGVPNLRLKKIRSLRTTVDERNSMTKNKGSIIAPRRVNSSTTWRKNKTVFSTNSEKKDYGDEMIGFVTMKNNNSNKNGLSDFAEI